MKKCEFGVTRTKYLGFIINTQGVEVDPNKVVIVQNWQLLSIVKGIQSFLGFYNFYWRFIYDFRSILRPLVHLTKANVDFKFDYTCQEAFEELKQYIIGAPILYHYDVTLESIIEIDMSDRVIIGILL